LHRRRLRFESLENRRLLASIIVNTLEDVVAADSQTSLREAIAQANANPDADIISFSPQLQGSRLELRDKVNGDFGNAMLAISSDITIVGPVEISRDTDDGDARLFVVDSSGTLTLDTLTLSGGEAVGGKGGDADGGGGGGAAGLGGAIFNQGVVNIVDSTLTNNVARGGAGGRSGIDGLGGGGAAGGAIRNDAPNSTTDTGASGIDGSGGGGNKTTGTGRPLGSRFTVQIGDDGKGTDVFGAGGGGGGFGQMTNFAADTLAGGGAGGKGGFGGGGGGVGDSSGGENVITQNPAEGGFAGGEGRSAGGGGGAGLGGAIFNIGGTVSIHNSTLSANSALGGAGGEGAVRGTSFRGQSGSGLGGAIFNRNGSVTIVQTTIADNLARAGDFGDGSESAGGGIYQLQDASGTANLSLSNTIVANSQFNRSDVANEGGSVTGDGNLIVQPTGIPEGVIVVSEDPILGPLENNGGPTMTHALLTDSPAVDAGIAAGSPTPVHTYALTDSLDDSQGGNSLVSLGGTVSPSGYQFGPNQGLTLSGANIDASTYSIEITFSLSEVDQYKKIIDFKNSEVDSGLYARQNQLNFYGTGSSVASGGTLQPDVMQTLLFTRDDATKLVVGYLNGVEAIRFTDSSDHAVLSGPNRILRFFEDDRGGGEASAGAATQIILYSSAIGSVATASIFDQRGESFPRIVNSVIDIGAFESQIEVENTAPNLSSLSDVRVPINTPTKPFAFTFFDEQSSFEQLTLEVSSSNETLVPNSAITLAGVAGNRTLIVNPTEAESGASTITVTVTDPGGLTDQSQFVITVDPSGLSINFIYRDQGTGFDDPVLGQARRDALERAGRTFTSWFDHSGVIDIEVDPFPPDENDTTLASAGAFFPSTSNPGFGNLSPLDVEVLTGANNPGAVASMDVNFSNRNNFAFGDSIGSQQQDFHATMLHELTHAFGFFGNIRSDGKSDLRGRDNVWGPFDQFVADSSGVAIIDPVTFLVDKPRWDAAKTSSLTFIGPSAMAANGGVPVPLFSPSVFNIGDSVSHVDDDANGISGRTHLMTSIARPGLNARVLHPVERGIMKDIGYQLTGDPETTPSISQVDTQTIAADSVSPAIPLTVFDAQTAANELQLTATSSNPSLVPSENVVFTGNTLSRTMTITPLAGQTGTTTISLTVTDGDGLTDTQVFELNVGDGGSRSDVLTIIATSSEPITVEQVGDEIWVRRSDTVLQRVAASAIMSVEYTGSTDDDTLIFTLPLSLFPSGVRIHGGSGTDTLRLVGSNQTLDVSAMPSGAIQGIDRIDIASAQSGQLTLRESDIANLPDSGKTLHIVMSSDDVLNLPVDKSTNAENRYRVTSTRVVAGELVSQAQSAIATLDISGLGWTNPLNRLDVNNSGDVSASDALVIINLLSNSTLPDLTAAITEETLIGFAFFDPNSDLKVSPSDAIAIINFISEVAPSPAVPEQIITTLAQDIIHRSRNHEQQSLAPNRPVGSEEVRQTVFSTGTSESSTRFPDVALKHYEFENDSEQADAATDRLEATIEMLSLPINHVPLGMRVLSV